MAEQIPFSIIEKLVTKLGLTIGREIGLMYGVRSELEKLEERLGRIKEVLDDAEQRQEKSDVVAIWVRMLKDVVHNADDLFDDFEAEKMRRNIDVKGGCAGQVSDFFSSSNHLAFRFKMGHKMKAIRERLDDVRKEMEGLNFIHRPIYDGPVVRNRGTETCSVVDKSHIIVGRNEDKNQIIELLMRENPPVVAAVGMGGLGKTTLAQLVYNDRRVSDYFDLKMWVSAPNNFDVKTLVRNVIKSATKNDVPDLELDQLQQRLGQNLDGKRYLLVLDNVWNEDERKWGQFKTLLPVGARGSKVLVTTRSFRVASVIRIDSPFVVRGLNEDDSWELFESLAFRKDENQQIMHPDLVPIGRDIARMCNGVPLVIEAIGNLLYFKDQETQWLNIKNNRSFMLLEDHENGTLSVLRLSYDNLPFYLKQCFAYCALFPKGSEILKGELVRLWIAQGYVQTSQEHERLEDVGEEYFNDLLSRSLFQEVHEGTSWSLPVFSYKMHDLIHDLAQSVAKSDIIVLEGDVRTAIPKRVHHVSLIRKTNGVPKDLTDKPVRTLLMEWCGDDLYIKDKFISSLGCLRVLKLCCPGSKLPTSLGKLRHLRCLDLSYGSFENLPSSITSLKHLLILKLSYCAKLKELPRDIKKMFNLRHLEIDGCCGLTYMPPGLGELTQLQTLTRFVVGNDSGECRQKGMGKLSELEFLSLKGGLEITGLSNAKGSEAKAANLGAKQYLESLSLDWSLGAYTPMEGSEEALSVMESLQPHPNLKFLSVYFYRGVRFPNWMMNDGLNSLFPHLVRIRIWYCKRCEVLPPFGQLPSLKHLDLYNLKAVEYMEDYSLSTEPLFPSLKTLEIRYMPKLMGWGMREVATEQTPSYRHLEELSLMNVRTELCLRLISVSSTLKSLELSRIEDLVSLPEGLQHISTLQTLTIDYLSDMETLPDWIGLLTSLIELIISNCPKLTSLPKEMQSLRNLRTLDISDCPHLSGRCRKETGEDWSNISHIPQILTDEGRQMLGDD